MGFNRFYFGRSMIVTGTGLVFLGIFLLLIKLLMTIAWYASGAIVLFGLVLLLIGMISVRA